MAARRRNPITRDDSIVIAVVALAGGVAAAFSGATPTGTPVADALLPAGAAIAVTWAAASAPWWVLTIAGSVALVATTAQPALSALAAGAVLVAAAVGYQRANWPSARTVSGALCVQVLLRLDFDAFHGDSALVAGAVFAVLYVSGARRRSRAVRRRAWLVTGAAGLLGALATLGVIAAVLEARAALQQGERQARRGLTLLGDGDTTGAASAFVASADLLAKGSSDLRRPWSQPGRLVPVVAQHRAALEGVTRRSAELAEVAASTADGLDLGTLRLSAGRIDLDALRDLQPPLARTEAALVALDDELAESSSAWLVASVDDRLRSLRSTVRDNTTRVRDVDDAVAIAPAMLGADGPRRYFVAFTTPAEARGLGGFMGNFAEITLDQGQLTVSRFGRTADLAEGGADPTGRVVTEPTWFLERYGRFGFGRGPGMPAAREVWSNLTMAPDLPTVGAVVQQLYPQSGGQPIDGVIVIDPYGIGGLLQLTGPVTVPSLDVPLDAASAPSFLLAEQYVRFGDTPERVELLDTVAEATVNQLLASDLPDATQVGEVLAPLVEEGRIQLWSVRADETKVLDRLGASGRLHPPGDGDGFAVITNNASANKIDTYLRRAITYDAMVGADGRSVEGRLAIRFENTAPASGLPPIVIDNAVDRPVGTNRTYVTVYTAVPLNEAFVDGAPATVEVGRELGWHVAALYLDLPPGGSLTLTLDLRGELVDASTLTLHSQPLAAPDEVSIRVARPGQDPEEFQGPFRALGTVLSTTALAPPLHSSSRRIRRGRSQERPRAER